jgi:O-methyltransferase involved in polyketide biosynthesis
MCSRPYRLPFDENAVVFEVDSDLALLEKKRSILETTAGFKPLCSKIVDVVGDLSDAKSTAIALKKAGLDPNVRTDWIAEGLFEYLDPCYHAPILEMAQTTAPGSRMAFQLLEQPAKDHFENLGVHLPWKELVNREIIAKEALTTGWEKVAVLSEGDLAEMYEREVNLPGFNMVFLDSAISN